MGARTTKIIVGVCVGIVILATIIGLVVFFTSSDKNLTSEEIVSKILEESPIIDGHNDFPWNLRNFVQNDLNLVDFSSYLNETEPWGSSPNSHTDLPRLRLGNVGAQFWVAYTSCNSQYKDSVEQTIEQVDVIKRLVQAYPEHLQFATSADEIEDAIENGKIGSLIGVEGGHSIQSSFGILRMLYELGTRYMTLTHSCNTPWADSSPVDAPNSSIISQSNGLSPFGIKIIHEMNRLGMLVDLSHVSEATMKAGLENSKAPVIFSHSSSYTLCNHHRNVKDHILELVKEKNSLIMVNFYSNFVQCDTTVNATLEDVLRHVDYIKNITGPDHVGIGADYDGVSRTPNGLEDVSKYPNLFKALYETGRWTEDDLKKLAGKNLLRVLRDAEKVRDELKDEINQEILTRNELEQKGYDLNCVTSKFSDDKNVDRQKRLASFISDDFQEL